MFGYFIRMFLWMLLEYSWIHFVLTCINPVILEVESDCNCELSHCVILVCKQGCTLKKVFFGFLFGSLPLLYNWCVARKLNSYKVWVLEWQDSK